MEQQNRILRSLLNLQQESSYPLVPVKIVAKDLISMNSSMTVSAGLSDGIEPGMPVINSDGLVGQIIISQNNFSQVLPYSNSMFRVSAQIEGTRAYGIVSWPDRGAKELVMLYVPETIPVEPGQVVQTSGFGNQYPAGIPIGVVTRIEPDEGVQTQTIYLEAFTDLYTIAEGFVVQFRPDTTIINLNAEQQELF